MNFLTTRIALGCAASQIGNRIRSTIEPYGALIDDFGKQCRGHDMSYHIQIAEGFRVRFPSRSAEFAEGVEIGVLTTLLDMGLVEFNRVLSVAARRQAISLADALGYSVTEGEVTDGLVSITFRQKGYTAVPERKRPNFLKLVYSSDSGL